MHALLASSLAQLALAMVAVWAMLGALEVVLRLHERRRPAGEVTLEDLLRGHLELNNRIRLLEQRLEQALEARRRPAKLPISLSLN